MIAKRRDICNAIKNENRVQFVYNKESKSNPRIVDLYCMGKLKSNDNPTDMTEYIRGWQVDGFTNSNLNEWKLFDTALITNFKILKEGINKNLPKPKYDGKDEVLELDSKCSL